MNDQQAGPEGAGGPGAPGAEPTEEELRAALAEQMRNIRVEEVVVQTVVTLINLGAQRLGVAPPGPGEEPGAGRDLAQAQLAIESVRALLPLCPQEVVQQIQPALTQLQMVYAREAGGGAPPAAGAEAKPEPSGGPGSTQAAPPPRIWTPPGS